MKRRTTPRSKVGMDAALVEVRGKRPLTKQRIRHEVIPLLEFAWAAGLLLWTAEEYAAALLTLFPKEYANDPIIELSKHAFQMDERRRFIMQSGGQTETTTIKRAKRIK